MATIDGGDEPRDASDDAFALSHDAEHAPDVRVRRGPLRYPGGKWNLAKWILSYFPPHRLYVEPFGGGGSLLLQKPRVRAEVYNDLEGAAVRLFRVLRDPESASRLADLLSLTPYAREELEDAVRDPDGPDEVEIVRRLIVRNRQAMYNLSLTGGQCRTFHSAVTGRNGPTSGTHATSWANLPAAIAAMTARLRGVVIEHANALDLIPRYDGRETLFYVDPPYYGYERYYTTPFREADHRALAERLHAASGMAIVSGYPSALYDDELYAAWERHERPHTVFGGRRSTEVIWINPRGALVRPSGT